MNPLPEIPTLDSTEKPRGSSPTSPGLLRKTALEAYSLWASTYDSDPNPLLALEERELSPCLSDLRGKRVVDVGCGTGRWLRKCLQRGAQDPVGVDLSAEMLAHAAHKSSLRGRILRGDCLALPLRDGIADLVVCSFLAGYVADLGTLGRELGRISKSNADIYVTDFHPQSRTGGWRRTFRHGDQVVEVSTVDYGEEQIVAAFGAEGLKLCRSRTAYLGEQERAFFHQRGRAQLFDAARKIPAVLLCHFKAIGNYSKGDRAVAETEA